MERLVAPVGRAVVAGDAGVGLRADPLGGELPVEAGLVPGGEGEGLLRRVGGARFVEREAEPVAGAAEADGGEDRVLEAAEVLHGGFRVVAPGEGDVAGHPLGVRIVRAGAAEILRGDPVGGVDIAATQRLAGEVRPALHPEFRPAECLGRGGMLQQEGLGIVPAALAHPPEVALICEARVGLQRPRHGVDQRGRTVDVAAQADAGRAERLPVGIDQRQHVAGLRGQAAPEHVVEPRDVMRGERRFVAGEDGSLLGAGHRQLLPGAHDLGLGGVVAVEGHQRVGEAQGAGAGPGPFGGKEGDHGLGGEARGHGLFRAGADEGEARPVAVAGEEIGVFRPAATAVAEAQPADDVLGDRAAGRGRSRRRGRPVAGPHLGQRLGERRALSLRLGGGGCGEGDRAPEK
jgi:hypothetical protein